MGQGVENERQTIQGAERLKLAVSADADYQSAATAMATAKRAGVENIGLLEP